MKDGVSIIIPAYNEENTLSQSVCLAEDAGGNAGIDFEILIVNDASTDRTGEIAASIAAQHKRVHALHHPANRGMGGAFKTGLQRSSYSHVMAFPADNEHPVDGVLPILEARGQADIIIPFVLNPEVRTRHRRIISRCYVGLINLLFGQKIPYYNGLVLHRTELLKGIDILTDSFSFQTEAILKLLNRGATWKAVGVPLHVPSHTKTKAFRIRNILGVAATVARLWVSLRLNKK